MENRRPSQTFSFGGTGPAAPAGLATWLLVVVAASADVGLLIFNTVIAVAHPAMAAYFTIVVPITAPGVIAAFLLRRDGLASAALLVVNLPALICMALVLRAIGHGDTAPAWVAAGVGPLLFLVPLPAEVMAQRRRARPTAPTWAGSES